MSKYIDGYRLVFSDRKTLGIQVRNAEVSVRAPNGLALEEIRDFICRKRAWIERTLAHQNAQQNRKIVLDRGYALPFLGRPHTISVLPAGRSSLKLLPGLALFSLPENTDLETQGQKLFENYLKKTAREYFPSRIRTKAQQLGVEKKINTIDFRKTRSKWGHCNSRGGLQFNWLIMMAPESVIDYLISHEVSHLVHMDHSAQFWETVASLCPGYEQERQWLKQNTATLCFR